MGRVIDVREEDNGNEVVEITFGEEGECLRNTSNQTIFICDDLNDEKVEVELSDIDNLIKALQTAKKEWT